MKSLTTQTIARLFLKLGNDDLFAENNPVVPQCENVKGDDEHVYD